MSIPLPLKNLVLQRVKGKDRSLILVEQEKVNPQERDLGYV